MKVVKKRSEKLQKEISNGGQNEGKMNELQKLQRQGEMASSWLHERGIAMEGISVRGSWGEGVSTEFEVREVTKTNAVIQIDLTQLTYAKVVEQPKKEDEDIDDLTADVHRLFQ